MIRLVVAVSLLGLSACPGRAQEPDARIQQGEELAASLCAECHAIRATDQSPHAHAPPFRRLGQRLDLDSFMDRLRGGLSSGHPDMPIFRFTRDDARALVAYLRSIQRN